MALKFFTLFNPHQNIFHLLFEKQFGQFYRVAQQKQDKMSLK